MIYEHKVIVAKLLQGTGIVAAPDMGMDMYRYGDMPLFLLDCKLMRSASLNEWAAWYSLKFNNAGHMITGLAVRWNGNLRVKWDRLYEPAAMIFGRMMYPDDWRDPGPNKTSGILRVKKIITNGVHTREAV